MVVWFRMWPLRLDRDTLETRKEINHSVSKATSPKVAFETRLNPVVYEYVTIYQILDPTKHGAKSQDELSEMCTNEEMNESSTNDWFPYNWSDAEIITTFHTKYFNHFQVHQALSKHPNNWDLLDIQGKTNTVYVITLGCSKNIFDVLS